jgi:hypothetical protein
MAELPRYQQTGRVFADVPQLDFANVRESFKRSQSMAAGLDRLSNFANKFAEKAVVEKAEKFAVDNPITLAQIQEAQKSGVDPEELVKASGGGVLWQETLRKFQGEQLRSQLEVEAQTAMVDIYNKVELGELTDIGEIKSKFESVINGMSTPLKQISPESALRFQHSTGSTAKTLVENSTKKLRDDYFLYNQQLGKKFLDDSVIVARTTIETIKDPVLLMEKKRAMSNTLFMQNKEGGLKFAAEQAKAFDDRWDELVANRFENIALDVRFAEDAITGLPNISLTMQKLANGELGESSALWSAYDQDKKDKVIQSVYTRLTQSYNAKSTYFAAEKQAKEKKNISTLIDLKTPGKVPFKERVVIAKKLALDETITPDQYAELIDPTPKKKALTAQQDFWKNEAAYKIRTGKLTNIKEIQAEYGSRLPIDAIGDLLGPLATEDSKAADKFKSKYSGADYDPYHQQSTTQKKFIQITEATDKKIKEVNKDGTPVYETELAAAKAAAQEIENLKVTKTNIQAQKRKFNSLKTFGFNPDNGGLDDWAKTKYGSDYKTNKKYLLLEDDYKSYLEYKKKNGYKDYNKLPSDDELKAE